MRDEVGRELVGHVLTAAHALGDIQLEEEDAVVFEVGIDDHTFDVAIPASGEIIAPDRVAFGELAGVGGLCRHAHNCTNNCARRQTIYAATSSSSRVSRSWIFWAMATSSARDALP